VGNLKKNAEMIESNEMNKLATLPVAWINSFLSLSFVSFFWLHEHDGPLHLAH
jgi:hypothetical protein